MNRRWHIAPLLRGWLACLLLTVGCVFIYRESLGFGFVMFDDDVNFLFNRDFGPLNVGRLHWIATEHAVMMRYVPLGWFACCAIASIGGLDPFWFHFTSVALHAGACVVLYVILVRVFQLLVDNHDCNPPVGRMFTLLPFVLTAWWGWHPLRVETVAWATTLIYLLATLLGLCSVLALLHGLGGEKPRRWDLAASLLLFIAALLSHPAAIAFLPLLSVCAVMWINPHGSLRELSEDPVRLRRLGALLLPFLVAGVIGLIATLVARQLGSVIPHAPTPSLAEFGVMQRLAQACAVVIHFLAKTIWPADLSPAYPLLETVRPLAPRFLLSMVACAGIAVLSPYLFRRNMKAGLFAVATLASCAPFLGLQEHPFFPSDRYTHIASIGLVLCLITVATVSNGSRIIMLRVILPAFIILLPLWVVLSMRQLQLWSSDDRLFQKIAAIQTNPGKRDAYSGRLLNIHLNRGETWEARLQLERMRTDGAPDSTLHLLSEKIATTEAARGPALSASLLVMQSHYAAGRGDGNEAVDRLRRALHISPDFGQARFSLGMLLARNDDARGALTQLLWLRNTPGEVSKTAVQNLRASVAAAFRHRGEERLARLVDALWL